ncbi:hypothetical protein KP509_08G030200 [Ceratopteris richardii]|nr:hypothetical protein KP509_08G030200 [Ceratopteris richardii]
MASATIEEEEEQVKCECCGLIEECTPTYIAHVRDAFCGKWVCGLCAEAVKEEHARRAKDNELGMEAALDAHMSMCMQFSKAGSKRMKEVPDIAAAMTRLLRRSMDGSISPRPMSSPRRAFSRTKSCISNLPKT